MMKSVLFINYEYPPTGAGAATATYHFSINMARKGKCVSVLTSAFGSRRGRSVEEGVTVYRIPAFRKKAERSSIFQMTMYTVSALLHLLPVVKRERPDVIVVFFSFPCGPLGLFAYLVRKIPYVLLLRGGDVPGSEARLYPFHRLLQPLRRLIYAKSATIVANSEGLKYLALKADPGFRIDVVKNGVDTDFFSPPECPRDTDRRYSFIFAGRFCEQKNIGLLLKAFSLCLQARREIQLILLGDGPVFPRLKSQADALAVNDSLLWAGWRSKEDLRSFYRSSDCFVNPSFNEGMPNAVLEAMACGLPVLGSDCIGNREIILNDHNGFLFDPLDHRTCAARMIALVNNRADGVRLGTSGRKMCCEQFSWPAVCEELCSLLPGDSND
jgi:glycosyltransferase involved in cell wall biosynthesis